MSVRLQNISSHLKKETQENNMNAIDEDESIQLQDHEDDSKVDKFDLKKQKLILIFRKKKKINKMNDILLRFMHHLKFFLF